MTFVTKEWKDRLVEYAGRRKLKNVATGEEVLVDVSRSEGTVNQAGDAFSAANMNNLEQRIANEFKTMTSNFQAGVDSVYNQIAAQGTTPGSKALSDVVNAIPALSNNRYNAGYYAGRVQGQNDVIANPGAYGIQTTKTLSYKISVTGGQNSVAAFTINGQTISVSQPYSGWSGYEQTGTITI